MNRFFALGTLVWLLGAGPTWADDRGKPRLNEALRQTLLELAREDQAEAALAFKGPVPDAAAHAHARVALLEQIVAEYGWPGISLVGEEGAAAAWLIAQHADFNVPFQRRCLALVEEAHARGEVTGMQLAYLTDRVLIAERKPQRYGTQGAPSYSAEEKARVEARRRKLGLPSMAEMARERARMYQRLYARPEQARGATPAPHLGAPGERARTDP
jgi:hypothetical protein